MRPKDLKEVVQKLAEFKKLKDKLAEKGKSLTTEDFDVVADLRGDNNKPRLSLTGGKTLIDLAKEKAATEGMSLPLALLNICQERNGIPPNEQLVEEAGGDDLKKLIKPLVLHGILQLR
jgi:hypothetical protein